MANPEQLEILKRGVEVWNEWRKKTPDAQPDISGADLSEANLRRADLIGADLRGANLEGANLIDANLVGAALSGTNLTRANLSRALLFEANLIDANLVGAALSGTIFRRANLSLAKLGKANLSGADLSLANLNLADLSGASLTRTDLREADLSGADLSRADLTKADLSLAGLSLADLSGASLTRTDLREADLSEADLSRADLTKADLTEAHLSGADLSEAELFETSLTNIDLSSARGLESCVHRGASTIDNRTLMKSGPLPLHFLRGCGLSDLEIETSKIYRKDLSGAQITDIAYEIVRLRTSQPTQFYSCFISYSSKDQEFARVLHANLQSRGVRCWFAPVDMKIGDRIRPRIDEAIRMHDKLMLILSEHSVASQWVEHEVETAFEREASEKRTVLFPIRIDDAVMETRKAWAADIRRTRHVGDFRCWENLDSYQKAFERLLKDLKAEPGKETTAVG